MKEDKRSDEEIEKRKKKFGASIKMYEKSWHLGIPEVIFNFPEKMLSRHLLMQLQGILKRREERMQGNLEAKKEEELGK